MHYVFVPEALTPPYLLDLREVPVFLRDMLLTQVRQQLESGDYEAALANVGRVAGAARSEQDQYALALALLYQSDILRKLLRWEDALDLAQRAVQGTRLGVTQVARYNQAVATYVEGLLHYILRGDDKAIQSFMLAQRLFVESERYWGFEHHAAHVEDCRNVVRWMTDLLAFQGQIPPGDWGGIVPVYELVNHVLIRVGVKVILPYQVIIPPETLRDYLPSEYIPLEIEQLPFIQLRPGAHYLALKILTDGHWIKESQVGDLLLIEMVSPVLPTAEVILSTEKPFVRRTDGRVVFRPYKRPLLEGFVGIPRVLIREREEEEG